MKNKFLIENQDSGKVRFLLFSILFVFGLLILSYPQVSLATFTITTDPASTGTTSSTLNATVANVTGETYDLRGFELGTVSGNYNVGTSTESGSFAGAGTFDHATTSLTQGECYYFRAYVSSSTDAKTYASNEEKFLTGIDEPAGLTPKASTYSISFSWAKGAGADETVVRLRTDQYPTDISDGTEVCRSSDLSCTVSSLSCGSTYYFRAWSSTTDGGLGTTSDSYSQLTTATLACGRGRTCESPTVFTDSLVINQDQDYAQTREVELSLRAENVTYMSICNNSSFIDHCILEPYQESKSWTLTEGDGEKTVYVVFVSPCGKNSVYISDTITLKTPIEEVVEEEVVEEISEEAVEEVVEEEVVEEEVVEKPVAEMTIEELKTKIAEIQQQIVELLEQLIQMVQQQIAELL